MFELKKKKVPDDAVSALVCFHGAATKSLRPESVISFHEVVSLSFPQCESVLDAGFDADGRVTRCSSIRLACERMMRLKKSSSGTVGPRTEGAVGGAQRWSSNREPCR